MVLNSIGFSTLFGLYDRVRPLPTLMIDVLLSFYFVFVVLFIRGMPILMIGA